MTELRYRTERSARRTVVITVREDAVVVRAPYSVPDATIRDFVAQKSRWIEGKLAAYGKTAERFAEVRAMRCVLDAGQMKSVVFGADKNREEDGVFYFTCEGKVRRFFERTRGWLLTETVHSYSEKSGKAAQDVRLCDFKARWGSCDAQGVVKLNWRLLMLPPDLRDYVVVHEVCHLREMNHSPAFWRAVASLCPDYKRKRAALKEYSFLTEMYRG